MIDLALLRSANHWLSDERKGKFKIIMHERQRSRGKKLSGDRIANLEKMSECPALLTTNYLVQTIFDDSGQN
jgi:hypothetical protein